MYNVTQAFKTAASKPIHRHALRGTANGVNFTQADVVSKTFKITNQLCESSKISLGGVYTAKLELTFSTAFASSNVARGGWLGVVIVPQIGLTLADESIEFLPAPSFSYVVNEAKWTENGLSIVAYDNMTKFDKSLDLNESTGTAYDFLSYACQRCGVGLGMSAADCAALTNGSYTFGLYPDDSTQTYRDLIAWLAQACACFAYIGRDGNLYLKSLPDPSEVDTIDTSKRFTGASFSDFETYYTGISVVNIEANTTSYYSVTPDTGLTMNLGANPLLQYGTDTVKLEVRQAILNKLATFRAVPFSAVMLTNPAYDLGDCLKFTGGIADNSYCVVMQYVLDIDKISVYGFGENPALMSAQSKTDKDISGLRGQGKENKITYYTASNVAALSLDDQPAQVQNLRFATVEDTTVTLWQEYKIDVALDDPDTPAVINAHYFVDGVEEDYTPAQTVTADGFVMLGLQYYLQNVSGGSAHTFAVYLDIDGGAGTIALGDSHICLSGQGLVGSNEFSGVLEISDTMPRFVVAGVLAGTFTESVDIDTISATIKTATDTITPLSLGAGTTPDYIQDEAGDEITDEAGNPIEGEIDIINGSVGLVDLTEAVTISLQVSSNYSAFVASSNSNDLLYVGEDLGTGLFNTLYEGGE